MEAKPDEAKALRRTLEGPIYNRTLRREVGLGQLDYEVYVRTQALLALQTPLDQLVAPDELILQILHQTQELWLKCVGFEATNLVSALDADRAFAASATLDRMIAITRCLSRDIEVLFTLSPDVFQIIRRSLGNGSGLESPGYNLLLHAAEVVGAAFARWLARAKATLMDVYRDRAAHAERHRIAEQLCDWDGAFQGWLMAHFVLVRRTIGVDRTVKALDGFPTQALPARMTRPLFPEAVGAARHDDARLGARGRVRAGTRARRRAEVQRRAHRGPAPRRRRASRQMITAERMRRARAEFPLLARCVYLNSNSTGAVPRGVKAVLDAYWETLEGWRDEVWERWWVALHAYADDLAALIGGEPGTVVTDVNLSSLLGRLLGAIDFQGRPAIVTTDSGVSHRALPAEGM